MRVAFDQLRVVSDALPDQERRLADATATAAALRADNRRLAAAASAAAAAATRLLGEAFDFAAGPAGAAGAAGAAGPGAGPGGGGRAGKSPAGRCVVLRATFI